MCAILANKTVKTKIFEIGQKNETFTTGKLENIFRCFKYHSMAQIQHKLWNMWKCAIYVRKKELHFLTLSFNIFKCWIHQSMAQIRHKLPVRKRSSKISKKKFFEILVEFSKIRIRVWVAQLAQIKTFRNDLGPISKSEKFFFTMFENSNIEFFENHNRHKFGDRWHNWHKYSTNYCDHPRFKIPKCAGWWKGA